MANNNSQNELNSDNDSNSQNLSTNHDNCPEFYELYEEIKLNCAASAELFRIVSIQLGCDPDKNLRCNEITMGLHGLETLIKDDQWKEIRNLPEIKEETDKLGISFMEWNQFLSVCKSMVEKWRMDHKLSFY